MAASFDCKKAGTTVENIICNDEKISKLDEVMADNYKAMSHSNIGEGALKDLKQTQKEWIKERNNCANNNCIKTSYEKRINVI